MGNGNSCQRKKKFTVKQFERKENKSVSLDDFQILRAIGKGSFGKVCIVQKKDSMKMYAMKYVNKCQCVEKDAFRNVLREIEVLSGLEHPFLVNLWFTFQDEEDMFIVVDLLLGGDLRYHLQHNSNIEEDRVVLYICEIALALDYLRSKGIVHRDIKPENILIDDAGHVHITDFNIATFGKEDELVTSVAGTKPYMAPEVLQCAVDALHGYSFPADWWSLGITAYEMVCRVRPYPVHSSTTMEEMLAFIYNSCLMYPKSIDRGLVSLIQQLLILDPTKRLSSLKEMKHHSYLNSIDFAAVYNREVVPSFVPRKNQLNYDPSFELEEMILESKPLHKKKKRLSKRNQTKRVLTSQLSQDEQTMEICMKTMQKEFVQYNRESEIQKRKMTEKQNL